MMDGTAIVPVDAMVADRMYRVLCYRVIDALPTEALAEAAESLADVYRDFVLAAGPANTLRAIPAPIVARFGAARERPGILIGEDR